MINSAFLLFVITFFFILLQSVSPGVVDTEILPDSIRAVIKDRMLHSEDISQGVLYAIATPPHVQVHELTIKPIGETM